MARFCAYRDAAVALAQPTHPSLIVMYGTSGSGKTWLAQRLATRIGAVHIRSDVERKRLAGRTATDLYTPAWTQRTYAHLVAGALGKPWRAGIASLPMRVFCSTNTGR